MTAYELLNQGCKPVRICPAIQVPRSTLYRSLKPKWEPARGSRLVPVNRIPDAQRHQILALLHEERFVDRTPREIVPTLADEGLYLASIRTYYRILKDNGEVCERRHQARHIKRSPPILEATAPNQVWSWDISRIAGPRKGQYFFLYVMLDIYSRYVVGWMLAEKENARRAQHFIRETVQRHLRSGEKVTVHNDRGSPMTAGTTRELVELLGLEHSFSRPRTSDDNPFSEAHFRTMKYAHCFPRFMESLESGIKYFDDWFSWYNKEHHHVGLNLFTPAMVHYGRVEEVAAKRQMVLDAAYAQHPERFSKGCPVVKRNPQVVGINLRFKPAQMNAVEEIKEVVA